MDGREVVKRVREAWHAGKAFEYAIKWVPIDVWSSSDIPEMATVVDEKLKQKILPDERWAMKVDDGGKITTPRR